MTKMPATDLPLPLPPAPRTLEDTGLSLTFLAELICKVLLNSGRMSLNAISAHTRLPVSISEQVLDFMRNEHLCELLSRTDSGNGIVYQLSGAGRERAGEFLKRCQYSGPAPVPLEAYATNVKRQSIHLMRYTREHLAAGFRGLAIQETTLAQLGAGMNSGRAIIIHGPAGSGKTYIAEHLLHLLNDNVAVPHALLVDNEIIQLFDPHVHRAAAPEPAPSDALSRSRPHDARWQRCLRPMVMAGSELTLKSLDLEFDHRTRVYQAPPHVKANNGIFVVDDLGRQLVAPQDLMNRWIVPLDRRRDFLTLHTGYKFEIPFDVVVVFSSNKDPSELTDEAFLRRLGYKIRIGALTRDQYRNVFENTCAALEIPFSATAFDYLLREKHQKENRPLLACYPRDLLGQICDLAHYESRAPELTAESLDWAWHNYFAPRRSSMPADAPVPDERPITTGAQK